jgi:hypothetical protein
MRVLTVRTWGEGTCRMPTTGRTEACAAMACCTCPGAGTSRTRGGLVAGLTAALRRGPSVVRADQSGAAGRATRAPRASEAHTKILACASVCRKRQRQEIEGDVGPMTAIGPAKAQGALDIRVYTRIFRPYSLGGPVASPGNDRKKARTNVAETWNRPQKNAEQDTDAGSNSTTTSVQKRALRITSGIIICYRMNKDLFTMRIHSQRLSEFFLELALVPYVTCSLMRFSPTANACHDA